MPRLNLVQERFIDTSLNIFCELIFFTTVLFIDTILMKTMLIQYCNRLNRRNDIYIYIYINYFHLNLHIIFLVSYLSLIQRMHYNLYSFAFWGDIKILYIYFDLIKIHK